MRAEFGPFQGLEAVSRRAGQPWCAISAPGKAAARPRPPPGSRMPERPSSLLPASRHGQGWVGLNLAVTPSRMDPPAPALAGSGPCAAADSPHRVASSGPANSRPTVPGRGARRAPSGNRPSPMSSRVRWSSRRHRTQPRAAIPRGRRAPPPAAGQASADRTGRGLYRPRPVAAESTRLAPED
jgi:hypothetical protein